MAGHVRLELRNVVAKYPFERSRRFPGSSRILATETIFAFELRRGDTQLGPMLGSQQGEHCPPAPPKSIKRQATAGVTWRRFVPGRWLPDRATPLPPPSIGPLRRQELTGAWRVMKTAGRPPCPRARSVIQGVVERRLRPYLFGSLVFSSHVLQAKTFGHFSRLPLPLPVSIR